MRFADGVGIHVTEHAMWQAAIRFYDEKFDVIGIEPEVRAAFLAGRVSNKKPWSLVGNSYSGSLFAWTPDAHRVYALAEADNGFVVVTVMRSQVAA